MRRFAIAAVLLWGALACRRGAERGEVRLLDRWLSSHRLEMSPRYQVTIRGVTRASIPVRLGGSEAVRFTVPRDGVLRVGVGLLAPAGPPPSGNVVASVSWCDASPPSALASIRLFPRREPDRPWTDLEVNLADHSGRPVTLCLAAEVGDHGPAPEAEATVWFAEPTVRSPGVVEAALRRPNLIVITLDTTRADHLSCAGYPLPTTPNLDQLAADGDQFLNAIANAPWTLPSHASLFTGLYPREHGARGDPQGDIERLWRVKGLSSQALTLATQLKAIGYRTAGVVSGPMVGAEFGFAQGFDHYDQTDTQRSVAGHRRGDEITDLALHEVSDQSSPFFLFLNYFDPHWPYQPADDLIAAWVPPGVDAIPPERQHQIWKEVLGGKRDVTDEEKQAMVTHYDGAIASMDRAIGRLLAGLKERGLYDQTMIVAVSDHGESFGEHRMLDHGHSLYDDLLRVGLIVKYSKGKRPPPTVSTLRVDLLDVYTTICRELGIAVPPRLEHFGLHEPAHEHFAELERNTFYIKQYGSRFDRDLEAVYRNDWKLIRDDKGQHWLFDLARDPLEERNLAEIDPDRVAPLDALLNAWGAAAAATRLEGPPVELTSPLKERLRALGYVGD